MTECGIGVFVWSTVMAYNGDKLKEGPKTWAVFFDTAPEIAVKKPIMMMLAIILLPRPSAIRVAEIS